MANTYQDDSTPGATTKTTLPGGGSAPLGVGETATTGTSVGTSDVGGSAHRDEAKSRFSAALDEAKAGAAALRAEAGDRASSYKTQARDRGQDYSDQARAYSDQARTKASELAIEGKNKASEALLALSRMVDDNAASVDSSLGAKYGDYARTASRSLKEQAEKLDQKSVEQLGEDAREYVKANPGTAVGIAALAGYLIARTFSSGR